MFSAYLMAVVGERIETLVVFAVDVLIVIETVSVSDPIFHKGIHQNAYS